MTSIGELFPKCRKLAYDSRQQLRQVQNGILHSSELFLSLDELGRQLDIMEVLAQQETPAHREGWKRKILELREDASSIQRQAQHYDTMVNANVRHVQERNELLRRRRQHHQPNDDLNNLAEEGQSLQQSQVMVDDLIGSAQSNLSSLKYQRETLRGVKRYISEIGNHLDLSSATMRIIERRDVTDAYLVLAGMVVTCIVIYLCWF